MFAVLLLNLGSPAAAAVPAVRQFLREFLGDPFVIPLPQPARKILLECVILPFRAKKSAQLYARMKTEKNVFPLIAATEKLRERTENRLAEKCGKNIPVFAAMRYGEPSCERAARAIAAAGIRKIFVVPLYPQRAESSWDTAVFHAEKILKKFAPQGKPIFLAPFFAECGYISALAGTVKNCGKNFDKILFSFHGVPAKTRRAESYREECETTARLVAEMLKLPRERWEFAFQSRFGHGKWLLPETADRLRKLPAEGCKNLAVIAPGFVADCLETLDELAVRGKEIFCGNGGENFSVIPCLNDDPAFADFLAETIAEKIDY